MVRVRVRVRVRVSVSPSSAAPLASMRSCVCLLCVPVLRVRLGIQTEREGGGGGGKHEALRAAAPGSGEAPKGMTLAQAGGRWCHVLPLQPERPERLRWSSRVRTPEQPTAEALRPRRRTPRHRTGRHLDGLSVV
eukprot:scaffold28880_cov71-Phaeocystis_antarctica.AAC.1